MLAFLLSTLESEDDKQKFVAIYEQYHEKWKRLRCIYWGASMTQRTPFKTLFFK